MLYLPRCINDVDFFVVDHTRVKLQTSEDEGCMDYINASYIPVSAFLLWLPVVGHLSAVFVIIVQLITKAWGLGCLYIDQVLRSYVQLCCAQLCVTPHHTYSISTPVSTHTASEACRGRPSVRILTQWNYYERDLAYSSVTFEAFHINPYQTHQFLQPRETHLRPSPNLRHEVQFLKSAAVPKLSKSSRQVPPSVEANRQGSTLAMLFDGREL